MKKLHVLSNTHWDREHRHAFQEKRIMLIELIDELIEIMENDPSYKYFTLDGQSVVLEDYLEARPHMRERLTALIRAGRILIGPWYSLVDCFSVNPESIIRNLRMGRKVCGQFGETMKVGYSIFSFGQMAQLPQIYDGFGINDIVFYKGASTKEFPQSEFVWMAPNGSRALTTRLGKERRWNFYIDFDIPVLLGGSSKKPGWEAKFTDDTRLCHLNDENHKRMYATLLKPDIFVRKENIKECIDNVLNDLKESASDTVFAAFDGTDFTAPFKETTAAIEAANEMLKGEVELVSSNPRIYFDELRKSLDLDGLKQYVGEMRFGPVSHLHSETMGSNTEIKQASFHAENTLINYAEPLSIMAGKYDCGILEMAWKYLLQAHAHDSIHGSGDPKIKTDNLHRLEKAQEIADSLTKRAVEGVVRRIDFGGYEKDDIALTVFNTTPYTRSEVMTVTLDMPECENVKELWIEDGDGNRLESYKIGQEKFNLAMIHGKFRPQSVYSERFTLNVYFEDVPAMGFKTYKIKRVRGAEADPFPPGFFPYNPIGISGNMLDNGLIKVTILPNGTLNVYDYETGKSYHELHALRDIGSSGDFWVHREPFHNSVVSSKGGAAQIELLENSGLLATYRVTVNMDIPENNRRGAKVKTAIVTDITVRKNSKRIDFTTRLNNQSKNHMLVVDFPTGIKAEFADWEAPFEVRKRKIDSAVNHNGVKGDELERQTIQNFINVSDEKDSFALFTKGIKEIGTIDLDGAFVSLTLFRAVTGTFPIHNDLFVSFENETSQCEGEKVFEYAVSFGSKQSVIEESRLYITPMLSAQTGVSDGGVLPDVYSFLQYGDKNLCLSALMQDEEGNIILRVSNPTDSEIADTITFGAKLTSAQEVSLGEEDIAKVQTENDTLPIIVKPYEIKTFKICINGGIE